jgi:hypothetical protein
LGCSASRSSAALVVGAAPKKKARDTRSTITSPSVANSNRSGATRLDGGHILIGQGKRKGRHDRVTQAPDLKLHSTPPALAGFSFQETTAEKPDSSVAPRITRQ